jgi:TetR/AcrR family transcriptional regulator, repressor of fatR-cypB operon
VYTVPMGKREDILAATRDLIVEEGIHALSFSKIFERAGVGSGTVYNYFSNKEELVNGLYRESMTLMDSELLSGYDARSPLKERFRSMLVNMANFVRAHPRENAVLTALSHSPYIDEELRDQPRLSTQAAFDLFAEGQRNGTLAPMDAKVAMSMVTVALICIVEGQLVGKYPNDQTTLDQAMEACWRMVAMPGKEQGGAR